MSRQDACEWSRKIPYRLLWATSSTDPLSGCLVSLKELLIKSLFYSPRKEKLLGNKRYWLSKGKMNPTGLVMVYIYCLCCSATAVEETKQFITSVVVGKDVVPRIGLHQLEAMRQDLINVIKRSTEPKV